MPEICRFFGIVIRMYHDDHGNPHFHAYAEGQEAVVDIQSLEAIEGFLKKKNLGLVLRWASLHHVELMEDWKLARRGAPLKRIPPLK